MLIRILVAAALVLPGCVREVRQSAFEAWGVSEAGIPEYQTNAESAESGGLLSIQVIDPGFSESEAKQIAASVFESRRQEHPAIVVAFVTGSGERRAFFAESEAAAQQLKFLGLPEEAAAQGYPLLSFITSQ